MNNELWGNIIYSLSGGAGFAIYGNINNENDYNSNVVFEDSSKKPAWVDVQAGQDGQGWMVVRSERDTKLDACDWTVLPDVPMDAPKRTEWETYRQSLRDVTSQPDPFNITWPTPPA